MTACLDCPTIVSRLSKTGRCRPCALRVLNANPEYQARRVARLRAVQATPDYKEKHHAGTLRAGAERRADPVKLERMREMGRIHGAPNIIHTQTPEARAACGKATQRAHLAWCPEEYWPLNQILKRSGYRLADRKAMIADEARRAAAKQQALIDASRATMTSFDRQMERVRAGAGISIKQPLRRPDPAYTLGGVATGAL